MTWLLGIKIYATLCLISTALFGWIGQRHNKRRRADDLSELPPIIRTWQ